MFQDTRPADLDGGASGDPWREFRVTHAAERLALLRQLQEGSVPVHLCTACGVSLTTSLWACDSTQERLSFSAQTGDPRLNDLIEAGEVVAVAYLDSVKLQFEVDALVLVRGRDSNALQCRLPTEIYRFQRRSAFRVRPLDRHSPTAYLRHPSLPDMALALRVIDVSIGGCALWLPADVPALQPGTLLSEVRIELDAETRFSAALVLQHLSSALRAGSAEPGRGLRMGCEWKPLTGTAERALQRWIDLAQKRRRLLALR